MDLRLTFNTAVENYDRFRPTYTEELYEDVIRYAGLDGEKDALEIGIGTGQATPPFLRAARRKVYAGGYDRAEHGAKALTGEIEALRGTRRGDAAWPSRPA